MSDLFNLNGAHFSPCGNYRYALWRIWDDKKPLVMFIGLNPSTANQDTNDPTITRVCRISRYNGFGGVYMMNCFPFVTPYPEKLQKIPEDIMRINDEWLVKVCIQCSDVVFAWGNFDIVPASGRWDRLAKMFPTAKALHINKNGSPKHPLYCKTNSKFTSYFHHS
ncbi:DUF1643 domain-containing protein [Niabella insulamsoli]|uniref:DUF1643 domain-containing protein n=1 Tax=Niabella insulamsoli TaxID=3144874 RepID=UPI0031FC1769